MSSLDDLFDRDEQRRADRRSGGVGTRVWPLLRWALAAAAGAALLGGGLALVLYALGIALWYPLVPAGVFAVLVLRRSLVGLAAPPAGWRAGPAADPPADDPADPDGLVPAVYRWISRVRWERAGLWRSSRALQPHLAELVDERLRQRHGCTRASEPERARRLLGDRLWTYLANPAARTPPPRELAAMLTTVEEL